jgi:GT2 family glycosyltransferase
MVEREKARRSEVPETLQVFVIHWNNAAGVRSTVRSILGSKGIDVRVSVLDNASDPEHRQGIEDLGVEILDLPHNVGFAGAANEALERARSGELVAISAHDVSVGRDTIQALVHAICLNASVAVVGPKFSGAYAGPSTYTLEPHAHLAPALRGGLEPQEWIPGAFMLLRPSLVEAFDERLFAYVEDVDLCLRAWRSGWVVARLPSAPALETGRTVDGYSAQYLMLRNHILIARWHLSPSSARLVIRRGLISALKASFAGAAVWRGHARRKRSVRMARAQLKAVADARAGRFGPPPPQLSSRAAAASRDRPTSADGIGRPHTDP